MKLRLATIVACTLLVAACSNDMNAGDYTFACNEQAPCAEGFFCSPQGICVENRTDVSVEDTTSDTAEDVDTAEDTASDADEDVTNDASDVADVEDTVDTSDSADTSDAEDSTGDDTCVVQTWYRDCDDDGFAGTTTEACDMPTTAGGDCPIDGGDPEQRWKSASEIENTEDPDCDDNDPRAFPGQTEFFSTEREEVGGFDFDCNDEETPRYADVSTGCEQAETCDLLGSRCNPTAGVVGWQNSLASCGVESAWVTGCSDQCVGSCNEARTTETRVQTCN